MVEHQLTLAEQQQLLQLARQSLEAVVQQDPLPRPALELASLALQQPGASFVTLTIAGELRGCIGILEAHQPLVLDVIEHAAAAAVQDPRFPPVQPTELAQIRIEVSYLTPPTPLLYQRPEELLQKLRPGIDGLILKDGWRRATFLPQVWQKLPAPEDFLEHLCYKMGVAPQSWRLRRMEAWIYQVQEFAETEA